MKTYNVSFSVSKKIKTAKDLSDFYAFVESFNGESDYLFPTKEKTRIEKLSSYVGYIVGKYDAKNVKRICGGALRYELKKRNVRQKAIDYQVEQSTKTLSYGELVEQQNFLYKLAKRYGLIKEFKENGII